MSRVTNLILTFSVLEDVDCIIDKLRLFDVNGKEFGITSVKDERLPDGWYGGTRRLEANILIGAYNYLDLDQFVSFLRNDLIWEAADLVQLVVKEQEDMKFRIIELVEA